MENAVKALEMAAGVLLGVILMALVAYFFTNISSFPENEEDLMSVEQLRKFNLEYEVYNKTKMYGVDVLSCLNKVVSNNEKYAQGGAFLGGNAGLADYKQRENYWINVKLKLKNDGSACGCGATGVEKHLSENLKIYYINENNKEIEKVFEDSDGKSISQTAGLDKLKVALTNVGEYTNFDNNTLLKQSIYDSSVEVFTKTAWIKDGYVNLIYKKSDGNVSDMNPDIQSLLKSIQTLSGNQGSPNLTFVVRNTTKKDYKKWTQIIWETVLYDLKNRKFTCTDFTYNNTTGRVNEIVFEEI